MKNTVEKNAFIMGTDMSISIDLGNGHNTKKTDQDIQEAFNIFYDLEKKFSRFSETSELSDLNRNMSIIPSEMFYTVMKIADEIYEQTFHYFNPLINISQIGYNKSFEKGQSEIENKLNQVKTIGFSEVKITPEKIILPESSSLDLGGLVKGYSVDIVHSFLQNEGYSKYIIDAGGDMYIYGNERTIGIDNPFNENDIIASITLSNISISSSGTYKRTWSFGKKKLHHILNPLSGENEYDIVSITLLTEKVYLSDAYATACIAMGLEKALIFLEKKSIDYIIITSKKNIMISSTIEKYQFISFEEIS